MVLLLPIDRGVRSTRTPLKNSDACTLSERSTRITLPWLSYASEPVSEQEETVMVAAMQQIALLLLLLAAGDGALATAYAAGTTTPLINTTCAAMANSSMHLNHDTCVGALTADPAGASAKDVRALSAVATNLTAANITSTLLVLADLVDNLGKCLRIYREMNASVAGALDDIRAGRADAATKKLSDATDEPDECDLLLFEGTALKNPMRKENLYANFLSDMAYGITALSANLQIGY